MEVKEMKLGEKIRIVFVLIGICMLLYVPAWAVINRVVGSNIVAGDGLRLSPDSPDTVHVNIGWGFYLDNDTTKPNVTQIWTDSLWEMIFTMVETTDAVIDSAVGAERAAVAAKADSALAFTHDGIKDWHIDWGSGTGQVNLADVPQTAWRVFYSNGSGVITELALGADGTYLRSNGASAAPTFDTPPGGDPGAAINDSIWYYDEWGGLNFAVDWANSDSFAIFFPISEQTDGAYTHRYFVRIVNISGTDNLSIPIHFSGTIPGGFSNDCDSVTVAFRTSDTDTTVTKINLRIFAEKTAGGFAPEDTAKYAGNSFASGSAGTWDWENIPGASIDPIAELSQIALEALCYADAGDTLDIEIPNFCAMRK
jgi:hypothetical protein